MGPINLEVVDTPVMEQTKFEGDMIKWLPNLVDIINASFTTITNAFSNFISSSGIDIGGSGAGPISVTVTGLTSSGYVNANIISTSNPGITIASITSGTNSFAITFSADPGASAIIVYQAFTSKPQ